MAIDPERYYHDEDLWRCRFNVPGERRRLESESEDAPEKSAATGKESDGSGEEEGNHTHKHERGD